MIFVRNVLRAPARSVMTALGVSAGTALFVAVSAITTDVRQQVAAAAAQYGLEVVVYERRATSPFSSRISSETMAVLQGRFGPELTPLAIGTRNEPWNPYVFILGVPEAFQRRVPLTSGSPFAPGSGAVVVGEVAAAQLGIREGSAVEVDGSRLPVAGVYRTGSRVLDGGFMMDLRQAQGILTPEGSEPQYSLAVLRTGGENETRRLIEAINADYPALRAIPGTEFAGAMRLMRVVDAFVKTLAVIALVGTCLVVANTLLMALAERTREIGILMTVGWTPWMVLRMLLAEGVVLCLLGAALGNGFALVLLRVINGIESIGYGWIPVRFSLPLAGASVAMALAVAVVALAWPAVILYRVQPLAALRHE